MGGPVTGGFFGSGGKSQTTTNYTETRAATGQAYSDRGSQAYSGFQLQDSASVNFNDLGAIGKAFDFTKDAIDKVLGQSSAATAAAADAYKGAQQQAGAVNADQLIKLGVGAIVFVVGILAWVGARK